ncbi:hypothetical protein AAVH_43687, partial [Aphelenchoides avenae]
RFPTTTPADAAWAVLHRPIPPTAAPDDAAAGALHGHVPTRARKPRRILAIGAGSRLRHQATLQRGLCDSRLWRNPQVSPQ